jgi:hypothetical protein
MANRAARRHAAPDPPATGRITVSSGEWYVFGPMTGRDFLFLRGLIGRKLGNDDYAELLGVMEKRITSSSVADPIDRPNAEIVEVAMAWFTGKVDTALPPENATS